VNRTDPVRARPLIFVIGEFQPIVIFHAFSGAFGGVEITAVIIAKAGGFERVYIQGWLAIDDPFGEQFADASRAAKAIQGHPARHPHSSRSRHRTNDGLAIRRISPRMANQGYDFGFIQEGNPTDGAFQELFKTIEITRQRGVAMFPWNPIDPALFRVGFVTADYQTALFLAHINQIVGIA